MLYNMTPPPAGYVLVTISGQASGPDGFRQNIASFYAPRGIFSNQTNADFKPKMNATIPCYIYFYPASSIQVAEGLISLNGNNGFSIFDGEQWGQNIKSNITVEVFEPKLT